MKTLTNLGLKYNTDKAYFHLFTEFYNDYFEKYMNRENIHILEIGIFKGGSLRMLSEYFPNATIHAIDIEETFVNQSYGPNVITHLCSQIDFELLQKLFTHIKFDIIIDDGSHQEEHNVISFKTLWKFLKPNGIYIIEDVRWSFIDRIANLHNECEFKDAEVLQIYRGNGFWDNFVAFRKTSVYL
jgi:demethylmacrocin O-methyltransferase